METFTPIAMKCTQEQFDAIKPKLKGLKIHLAYYFDVFPYLTNMYSDKGRISNVNLDYIDNKSYDIHEEWNEEIFLKACGIKVEKETLQEKEQRLLEELEEVRKEIEENNKIKTDDWVIINKTDTIFKVKENDFRFIDDRHKKITDQELINKLNELIK